MKDQDFVTSSFQNFSGAIDTGRGVAELAGDDDWFVLSAGGPRLYHAANGSSSSSQYLSRDSVEPRHIHNAGKHHDIFHADILGGIAAGEGGYHQFGKSDWQRAHCRSAYGCAASTAKGNDAINSFLMSQACHDNRGTLRHGVDGSASILFCYQLIEIDAGGACDFTSRDVWLEFRVLQNPSIDYEHLMPALADLPGDKGMLFALRVHSAKDGDRSHKEY